MKTLTTLPYQHLLNQEIQSSVLLSLCQDLGVSPDAVLQNGIPEMQQCRTIFKAQAEQDVTASLIDTSSESIADVICKEDCVFVGRQWVNTTFSMLDSEVEINWFTEDGKSHKAGETLFSLQGNTRAILTGERTALNFAQTLSSTATIVNRYAAMLSHCNTQILDTRKTLPGLRFAQKYAVLCGGGENHRVGLYDRFLIKENHIMGCGSIAEAISKAKSHPQKLLVEVEVENLAELQEAICAGADIIMLDNFDLDMIHEAVAMNNGKVKLEVSGNVESEQLQNLAQTGVDYISSGALTKHINAIDLSLRLKSE